MIVMLSAALMNAQNSIRVEVQNIVSTDEQFNVTFIIEGEDRPSSFDWTPGQDFNLVWGPQTGSSTSINIVNGKRTKSSQFTYTYILSPKSAGKFHIQPASATVGGKTISSRQVQVEVVAGGSGTQSRGGSQSGQQRQTTEISGDDIFMKLTLSKTNAVVGEPITATLKLYQRVDVAGFEDAKFPSFEGFWSQETEAPNNISFSREVVGDQIYNSAVIRRYVLIPQKSGTLKIDPAELVCLVNVRVQSRSNSIFDDFFGDSVRSLRKRLSTPAVNVHVRALPAGAPASFGGGVGSFTLSAKFSKDSLKTHDASSLLVTVSGKGNVSLLTAPSIQFPADFEVYDVKSDVKTTEGGTSGSKTFEYPFIPRSHGDFEIPDIQYSYYDVNAGKYVVLNAGPVRIKVGKGKGGESSGVVSTLPSVERRDVRSLGEDIRFINTRKPSLSRGGGFLLGSAGYWIVVILIILAAAAVWFVMRRAAARRADVVGTRTRGATRKARKRLAQADEYLKKDLYTAFYEELHKALLGFISDKMNMKVEDLNKETITARLLENKVPESVTAEFTGLLDACEYARYAPGSGNEAMRAHYDTAVKVISSIDSGMKAKKAAGAAVLAVLMLLLPGASVDASEADAGYWEEGVSAYQEGRWKDAAGAWENAVADGVESAVLYYNIGNAWFKDGNVPKAILNYERALKLNPSYDDARFNLEFARTRIQDRIEEVPEFVLAAWGRKMCYKLSSNVWAVLFIVFLAGALAMLLTFLLSSGRGARRAGFFSAIGLFLVALLCLDFAYWQYSDYRKTDSAIVMVPVSSVKSSPSSGVDAKDLFVLHEGTKVRILDEAGDWMNIELADGRQGWMRKSEVEMP